MDVDYEQLVFVRRFNSHSLPDAMGAAGAGLSLAGGGATGAGAGAGGVGTPTSIVPRASNQLGAWRQFDLTPWAQSIGPTASNRLDHGVESI